MLRTTLRPLTPTKLRRLSAVAGTSRTFTTYRTSRSPLTRRVVARTLLGALTASSIALATTIYADDEDDREVGEDGLLKPSLGSMIRAYAVYSMCSIPWLVDSAPGILQRLSAIPVVNQITERVVRLTFFKHFVGADTAEECIPLLHTLRRANKGALFAYSVEVDENHATGSIGSESSVVAHSDNPHKRIVNEMIHCIDVSADFEDNLHHDSGANTSARGGKRTWIAVKLTALLPDADALVALSSWIVRSRKSLPNSSSGSAVPFPGAARIEDLDLVLQSPTHPHTKDALSTEHLQQLKELHGDLVRICTRAKERDIKVIIDAEYSWYQPAIDALTLALMREFNSLSSTWSPNQPLVYGTFQAYLRRTPSHIAIALEDSKKHNYSLGVKLVRGAYHPHEIAAYEGKDKSGGISISPDPEPPVWTVKADTDTAYDQCVKMLIKAVKDDVVRCRKQDDLTKPVTKPRLEKARGWLGGSRSSKTVGGSDVVGQVLPSTSETRSAPSIGVLFGTHNWRSCGLVLDELVKNGLGQRMVSRTSTQSSPSGEFVRLDDDVVSRIAIGQLYGMSDDLSDWIVSRTVCNTPLVLKYVPYGALADVMPYLSRRAVENKSVLGQGGAANERRRAGREIWQRLFG